MLNVVDATSVVVGLCLLCLSLTRFCCWLASSRKESRFCKSYMPVHSLSTTNVVAPRARKHTVTWWLCPILNYTGDGQMGLVVFVCSSSRRCKTTCVKLLFKTRLVLSVSHSRHSSKEAYPDKNRSSSVGVGRCANKPSLYNKFDYRNTDNR